MVDKSLQDWQQVIVTLFSWD